MSIVLSHISAALVWLSPEADAYRKPLASKAFLAKPSNEELRTLPRGAHLLVPANLHLYRRPPGAILHFLRRSLPPKSLLAGPQGVIVSPELCFLQIAEICDLPATVRFGSELCSRYVRTKDANKPLAPRAPLTTPAKIAQYLDQSAGAHGVTQAKRAVGFLAVGARSPREIELSMGLFMPSKESGYGLPKTKLNKEVPLGKTAGKLDKRSHFECDFLWEDKRLVLEYDGGFSHSSPSARTRDASKRNTLSTMGFTVITATPQQVSTYQGFDALAKTIAKHLGVRTRKQSRKKELQRIRLWSHLFCNSDPAFWLNRSYQEKLAEKANLSGEKVPEKAHCGKK